MCATLEVFAVAAEHTAHSSAETDGTADSDSSTLQLMQPPDQFSAPEAPITFQVYLRDCSEPEYLIPYELYAAAAGVQWRIGQRIEAVFAADEGVQDASTLGFTRSRGTVIEVSARQVQHQVLLYVPVWV